ncbi:polyprenol phosphomannose-dependent alpha 1,6 mannosyltransferase MptB [Allokutzneria multivorans]|uniref:Polyprenol phosphomannose-dependent alpha 1,6 mannosyltransferase MptB n=1 Tax=Allokutzneria multivorans TaxID=1142134 RepID=A0ABP7S5Z9_9PSEU
MSTMSSPPITGPGDEPDSSEPGGRTRVAERPVERAHPGQVADSGTGTSGTSRTATATGIPSRTILLGVIGACLAALGALGAGGILVRDPILSGTPLTWVRFGHGKNLAELVVYLGVGLLVWAWVRLGRHVRAGRVGRKGVLLAIGAWCVPVMLGPPLFTRDVYSYLGQGLLPLEGLDTYALGPAAVDGPIAENVAWIWQTTPAPYGPLFILIAKGVVAISGHNMIAGVLLMRVALIGGLLMLCWALPRLAERVGGNPSVALWIGVANPLVVVHLVGGPHNDLMMVGLLAVGTLMVMRRQHVLGIVLVTLGAAIKIQAVVVLPFLVWIWARHLRGTDLARFTRAAGTGAAVFFAAFAACQLVANVSLGWIPALSANSVVINWTSLPTGAGQLAHGIASWFYSPSHSLYYNTARTLGMALLGYIALRQWWKSRDGEEANVLRRAALVMLGMSVLLQTTFPWYFTLALALAAALPLSEWASTVIVFGSAFQIAISYPDGDAASNNYLHVAVLVLLAWLAATSLVRPDPLKFSRRSKGAHL